MLLLHISRDILFLENATHREEIHFGQIEKHYPQVLKQFVIDEGEQHILALNGPGGFASLRAGCLAVNLLQMVTDHALHLYDLSKPILFQYAYQQGLLPRYGYIYIGQKKNLRRYDFQTLEYEIVNESTIQSTLPIEYFVDDIVDHQLDAYIDPTKKIRIAHQEQGCVLYYHDQQHTITIDELALTPITYLSPNYLMEPTIG